MDVTARMLRLERSEEAPAAARRWIEELAATLPADVRPDVTLLTHELVTNAVQHAEGQTLWVAAVLSPDSIRIEVSDQGGSTEPVVLPQEQFATRGRGLLWVDRLADSWGTDHNRAHYVWFQIDLRDKAQLGTTDSDHA